VKRRVSLGAARALTVCYLLLMTAAVVWPGAVPASRIHPFVLGLPFSFFWPALWVALSAPVLYLLDRVERRHRGR